MLQKLALFLVRKIPQNFTRVRLLVLSRTLVPSVLGTVFAASRYAVHLSRPFKGLRILHIRKSSHSVALLFLRRVGCCLIELHTNLRAAV